jgi:putative SOS response-associated peptidase YedK
MCGRYDNTIAAEAYRRLFGAERMPQSNFPQRYNVAPTDLVPIIRMGEDGQRELVIARWGLVPFWMKDIPKKAFINARAETVAHGLLRPCPAEMLKAYPVSRIVNSPRNDVPECVEPLTEDEL